MFKNYELVKKSELEALHQEIKDLNNDIRTATDLLARYDHVVMEQQKLIQQQREQIWQLIGLDPIDFPNSEKDPEDIFDIMEGGLEDQ